MTHEDVVRREFTRQLPNFVGDDSPFARQADATLAWLPPLAPGMVVLDVACGAAHVAEVVAPHVRLVVGIDLTVALLEAASERLRAREVTNVLLQEGDAGAMPFVDASFDVVCCRSSVHHFLEPQRQVAEMARVCRPGGHVAISDMVAPSASVREMFDGLHRQLDPSHVRAQLDAELATLVAGAVGPLSRHDTESAIPLPFDVLINESSRQHEVMDALLRELDGGPATGFAPRLGEDGSLEVALPRTVVLAERRLS